MVDQARFGLKKLYLECGWVTDSRTQDQFDRAKFMEMRKHYMNNVVRPLEVEAEAEEAWKAWHEHDEL